MKIARYEAYGSENIYEVEEYREQSDNYVRLSEIVEVELPNLPAEVTVPKQLETLARLEEDLLSKYLAAKSTIETKRANLRALTQQAPS